MMREEGVIIYGAMRGYVGRVRVDRVCDRMH